MIEVKKTDIEGVLIIEPKVFGDARGYFLESFNAKEFILNTDYNYLKLCKAGAENVVYSQGQYQPITITHNLGYHAQALFWVESIGTNFDEIQPINGVMLPNIYTDKSGVESYTDKFIIYPPQLQAGDGRIHYRIYYDEA